MTAPLRLDLFCRIIDNYGDIGVCWRLARQMHDALGWQVRLWVDALPVFQRLESRIDTAQEQQWIDGIEVRLLVDSPATGADSSALIPGDLVIEAFACDIPPAFRQALRARQPAALWLNLEYLSAEPWVEGCHGLSSQQTDGVEKYFFFPGFTARTGGLLREPGLLDTRDHFQSSRNETLRWLSEQGIEVGEQDRVVTLFAYPHGPWEALFEALDHPTQTVHLLQTAGLDAELRPASARQHVHRLPFLRQPDFDRLLWCADLNVVRGEDSFVRAQWAARPMLWHIYPQAEQAHLDKLGAWLALSGAPDPLSAIQLGWNGDAQAKDWATALHRLWTDEDAWQTWQTHSGDWSRQLASHDDLATSIHRFYLERSARNP